MATADGVLSPRQLRVLHALRAHGALRGSQLVAVYRLSGWDFQLLWRQCYITRKRVRVGKRVLSLWSLADRGNDLLNYGNGNGDGDEDKGDAEEGR